MTTFDRALAAYRLEIDERFEGQKLDPGRWIPYYLPQWSGRERARARYRLADDHLELFIAEDQPAWLPDIVPGLRVSSVQSGCFAGPVGSEIGQHRTDARMRVVEAQPTRRLLTPRFGALELRARWTPHPDHMVACWLIGFEEEPEQSAEICICEIFGSEATDTTALVGCGVHPFGDPTIGDDFDKVEVAIDVRELHSYGAIWTPEDVTFFVDGEPIKRVKQSPRYPMQTMINIYDFGGAAPREPAAPFIVDRFRLHVLGEPAG